MVKIWMNVHANDKIPNTGNSTVVSHNYTNTEEKEWIQNLKKKMYIQNEIRA